MHKRGKTNSFDHSNDEEIGKRIDSLHVAQPGKIKKSSAAESDSKHGDKMKNADNPEETKKKLEDAEYKDLGQRYVQDERDVNYVLNNQEAIAEARKAEEAKIELNESIEKIEEEQDLVFKEKVSIIAKETIKEMKIMNLLSDDNKLENMQEHMIHKVFECFLENKQELLKKIAGKLASQVDLEEYDGDGDGDDEDQISPNSKNYRKSNATPSSRKYNKHKENADTDMDDMKSFEGSRQDNDKDEDADYIPEMMDRSSELDGEGDGFVDNSEIRRPDKNKSSSRKKRVNGVSKESESQTTFVMNIQTTADLISYVKRRQHKRSKNKKLRKAPTNRRISGLQNSRIVKRENIGGIYDLFLSLVLG